MTTRTTAEAWLAGRIPADWYTEPIEVRRDRDELLLIGTLAVPTLPTPGHAGSDAGEAEAGEPEDGHIGSESAGEDADLAIAISGRVQQFREDTRERRIEIARELQHLSGKKVSWGVQVGDTEVLFTHVAAPVMTRLRQPERKVLDTLVDAGVARSRSEAVAWCIKLVGERSDTWLAELREAMTKVDDVRKKGPAA